MRSLKRIIAVGAVGFALVLTVTWLREAAAKRARGSSNSESDELADLERRVINLETGELFTVVDRPGDGAKKLFSITSTNSASTATVYDSAEAGVVSMVATADGGYFTTLKSGASERYVLGADDSTLAGLRFIESATGVGALTTGERARIELGRQKSGNEGLAFPAGSGEVVGIGESKAGTGLMLVGDKEGNRKATFMTGTDRKGMIGIFNGDKAILAFGEATGNTGGLLAIGDAKGEPRVKMGTNDNRYGVVMALPKGLPYVPKSGLPGSYMLGCAGGPPACVP
jgi:hypothetical protein